MKSDNASNVIPKIWGASYNNLIHNNNKRILIDIFMLFLKLYLISIYEFH